MSTVARNALPLQHGQETRMAVAGTVALLLFLLTVGFGRSAAVRVVDLDATWFVQAFATVWLDWLGFLLTPLGSVELTTLLAVAAAASIARGNPRPAVAILCLFALGALVELALKRLLHHPGVPGELGRPPSGAAHQPPRIE